VLEDFAFLAECKTAFASTLAQLLSGTEDVDENEVGALALWAVPVVSLGGSFVDEVVSDAEKEMREYLKAVTTWGEKPKVGPLRDALARLVRVIDPAVSEFTRYKRLLLLHGELDATGKTEAVRTKMKQLTLLNEFLAAVADEVKVGAGIAGMHGVVISHIYESVDVVERRFSDWTKEAARVKAFQEFRACFPMATKPKRPKVFLQKALKCVHGASFTVEDGEEAGSRPGFIIEADGMTAMIDTELCRADTAGLQKAADLWAELWARRRTQREEPPAAADPRLVPVMTVNTLDGGVTTITKKRAR
jgi:hypothetical protein